MEKKKSNSNDRSAKKKKKKKKKKRTPIWIDAVSILENTYIIMNRILVEIGMVKAILMRSQMEKGEYVIGQGEYYHHLYTVAKNLANLCLYFRVL